MTKRKLLSLLGDGRDMEKGYILAMRQNKSFVRIVLCSREGCREIHRINMAIPVAVGRLVKWWIRYNEWLNKWYHLHNWRGAYFNEEHYTTHSRTMYSERIRVQAALIEPMKD